MKLRSPLHRMAILFAFSLLFFSSCDEAELRVRNELPKVSLNSVSWGPVHLTSGLLPGQTSQKIKVYSSDEVDLPESNLVRFYMMLNGSQIYLETVNEYHLSNGDKALISIDTNTMVINPLLEKSFKQSPGPYAITIGQLLARSE